MVTSIVLILFCLYFSETNIKTDDPEQKAKGEIIK